MNEMRKLMEAIQQVNEGWDPEAIAQAIYDDVQEGGSALELAAKESPEPYRAMVYEFGHLTGLYNAEAIDGSQIWVRIIDKLEELFSGVASPEAIEEDDYYGGGHLKTASPREATTALHELMDEGILDARTVADACLNYMPESEVADMADDNSFFGDD